MEKRYKYTIDIVAQTTQFEQNMLKAASSTKKFSGGVQEASKTNGLMATGFAKLGLVIGGTAGALKILGDIIKSTKGSGSELESAIGGLKLATDKLFSSIAKHDFHNLIQGLKDAAAAGKKYVEELEKIEMRDLGLSLEKSKLLPKQVERQEIFRDWNQDPVERQKNLNDYKKTAVELATKENLIAIAGVKAEEDKLAGLGIEATKLKTLYETYSDNVDLIDSVGKKLKVLNGIQEQIRAEGTKTIPDVKKANELNALGVGIIKGMSAEEKTYIGLLMTDNSIKQENITSYIKSLITQNETEAAIGAVNRDNLRVQHQITGEIEKQNEELAKNARTIIPTIDSRKFPIPSISNVPHKTSPKNLTDALNLPDPDKMDKLRKSIGLTNDKINVLLKSWKELDDEEVLSQTISGDLTEVFGSMFGSIDKGVKGMAESVIKSIEKIVEELAAKAAAFLILSLIFPGSTIVTAGIGAFLGFAAPKLAEGGLAYGPTIAQVGEYPGASHNPEVIAPLNKLQGMINSPLSSGKVRFVIEGRTMVGILEAENRATGNIKGRG